VTETANVTQVSVAARNRTWQSLTLALYGCCEFTGSNGTTLAADPYRSH